MQKRVRDDAVFLQMATDFFSPIALSYIPDVYQPNKSSGQHYIALVVVVIFFDKHPNNFVLLNRQYEARVLIGYSRLMQMLLCLEHRVQQLFD